MPRTEIKSSTIANFEVKREDINTSESGSAVITKIIAGSGITITNSTGADQGTGDVTISSGGGTINDLNGQSGASQTFATGTSGTNFNISSASNVHTFNIPDASSTNRGLITTGAQTIAGSKTFSSNIIGSITGSASTLTNARNITATGDASWSVSFDGSANASSALTLATTGVSSGTYKSVTVDTKGRVTAGTNPTTLSGYGITDAIPLSQKGAVNGVATLDSSGFVTSSQLPSYVDDVVEYANLAGFPVTGETSKIYVALDTNKIYRWSGSAYIEISPVAGNADTATKLATARSISATGDATWSVSFDGSANVSSALTLATTGVSAGTYKSVTVDTKGRITAGTNPTTLSGYGITDALSNSSTSTQSGYFGDIFLYDDSTPSHYLGITNSANLTAARTLSLNVNDANRIISLSGDLTVSSAATISGTNTGDQTITLTGDVTGSGTGSFATTLANSGVTAGTYTKLTVDVKGRATVGATLSASDIPSLDASKITSGQLGIANGGTGQSTAQTAINALTQVSSATNEYVLTKDTTTGNAIWKPVSVSGFISSINGLSDSSQTFATGTSGTDFNISSASGTHTFNIPSASATNRGLITTGTQTIAGVKTFSDAIAIGTTPSATGHIRLPNNQSISSRNAANSADVEIVKLDSNNRVSLGAVLQMNNREIIGVNSIEQNTSTNWKLDNSGNAYFAGNVSIGTTTFGPKLDINGSLLRIANGSTGYGYSQFGNSATTTQNWHIGSEGDGTFRIYNTNFGSGVERLRITSGGDVGIGTLTPGTKLDVSGSIRSSSQLISTVATGTAPLSVTSTTKVSNLNADLLDDQTGSYYLDYNNFTNTPTIGNGTLTLAVSGTGLSGSASFTANQTGATTFTITSNATSANIGSTIVARDASGNFSAGTITANLTGLASGATTATYLNTAASSSTADNITTRVNSGFWESNSATTGEGWPETTNNWYHLLCSTHSNAGNYYSMQFAGSFFDSDALYYRATAGSGTTAWNRIWHSGNDNLLGRSTNVADTIVRRDINGSFVTSSIICIDSLKFSTTGPRIENSLGALAFRSNEYSDTLCATMGDYELSAYRIGTDTLNIYAGSGAFPGNGSLRISMTPDTGGFYNNYFPATTSHSWFFNRQSSGSGEIRFINGTNGVRLTTGATGWSAISDVRLKQDIEKLKESKNIILNLNPVQYKFKNNQDKLFAGFIAQEVVDIIPEAVIVGDDAEPTVENEKYFNYWGITPDMIIPYLTKALQEAFEEIQKLKERIEILES